MKLLIIGSQGFIGSHCYSYFSDRGYAVTGADIQVKPVLYQKTYHILSAEKPEYNLLFSKEKYDVCINASGSANVGFSFDNPEKDYELNVMNVGKMLEAIKLHSPECKFVNFSSAAVYGNPVRLPIKENDPTAPLSPYGRHKLASEELLKKVVMEDALHACSLRIFSAFGPGLRKQLFWDLYQKTLRHGGIELYGTGKESRDFIYIDDLTRVVEHILLNGKFLGEAINVASGNEYLIEDVAEVFMSFYDKNKKITFNGVSKQGDPTNWKADVSLLNQIGFSCKTDIRTGVKKYVEWLRQEFG